MVCPPYTQETSFFSIITVGLFLSTNSGDEYLALFSFTITAAQEDLITSKGHMANKWGDSIPGCPMSVSFRNMCLLPFPSLHKKQSSISAHDYAPAPTLTCLLSSCPSACDHNCSLSQLQSLDASKRNPSGISSATQMHLESDRV